VTRMIPGGSGCKCTVEIIDYQEGEEPSLCEIGNPDCTDFAVAVLTGPFWHWRMTSRHRLACESCLVEHETECRGDFGMHREGR
jgi:hypothetical protein